MLLEVLFRYSTSCPEYPVACVAPSRVAEACDTIYAGETFGTEDPRTGEVYTQVAEAQEADVDAAVKAARMVSFIFPTPVPCQS